MTNHFLVGSEACSKGGEFYAWYCKPGQNPITGVIIGHKGELTGVLLFMMSNYPLHTYVYTHRFVLLSGLLRNLFIAYIG